MAYVVTMDAEAGDPAIDCRAPGWTISSKRFEIGGRNVTSFEDSLQMLLEALLWTAQVALPFVQLAVEDLPWKTTGINPDSMSSIAKLTLIDERLA